MYEKDGERYFVVDEHIHYWDATPENRNKYGEGFINCFYDYHKNLSPEERVWTKEKFIEGSAGLCRGLLATRYGGALGAV